MEPASCEQLQTMFILCWHSFIPAMCEQGLDKWSEKSIFIGFHNNKIHTLSLYKAAALELYFSFIDQSGL